MYLVHKVTTKLRSVATFARLRSFYREGDEGAPSEQKVRNRFEM